MKGPTHEFKQFIYDANHWLLDRTLEGACIAFIKYKNHTFAFQINPTDCRGIRGLITFVGNKDESIYTTFNRPYTNDEELALATVGSYVRSAGYKQIGFPFVQTAQAGNNSQSFDKTTSMVILGNANEASVNHLHIWGRGVDGYQYIPGVPLVVPVAGQMFDMMAKTPTVPGNEKKVAWEPNQMKITLEHFQKIMLQYNQSAEFAALYSDITVEFCPLASQKETVSLAAGAAMFAAANVTSDTASAAMDSMAVDAPGKKPGI